MRALEDAPPWSLLTVTHRGGGFERICSVVDGGSPAAPTSIGGDDAVSGTLSPTWRRSLIDPVSGAKEEGVPRKSPLLSRYPSCPCLSAAPVQPRHASSPSLIGTKVWTATCSAIAQQDSELGRHGRLLLKVLAPFSNFV
ncbi:hypothetical protein MRX96_014810 [Rhipicephalus microplus]